ncbi:hypothetical protein ACFQRB_17485 [Halobaculum litoreum]|uniref:Uncharacterized protein n=1 Tax=Halobaculum litoreum TaxID=3031998 RepID=A0ABD5XRR7_9EURY
MGTSVAKGCHWCSTTRVQEITQLQMLVECYDTVGTEVKATSRLGVEAILDKRGFRDPSEYDEDGIKEKIENKTLLDLKRKKESKEQDDYDTFRYLFEGDPAEDTFDRLVNTVSDAINQSGSRRILR